MEYPVRQAYRPAAFWGLNDELEKDKLSRQLKAQCAAGLNGGFLHSRVGLVTEYLSEDWMDTLEHCCREAEKNNTTLWLYDEDRFPSGYAGGRVLEIAPELCSKQLCLIPEEQKNNPLILKIYNEIERDGKRYVIALARLAANNPWYGGKCYADFLNPKTIEVFLQTTHEAYAQKLGKYFGNVIRGVFSDEFCYCQKGSLPWPCVPFSDNLEIAFEEYTGYGLYDKIYQLFFDEGDYRTLRRDFYEFLTNRFRQCFTKPYQKWCHDHGLQFTGHLMNEDTLTAQTEWVGAVMPHYLDMDMPGIDKLGLDLSNTVLVKQLGSVAEQTGKQTLCEAFGCTGHQAGPQTLKRIADWLCVQGVSFINPHLMLYSMRGERKRDYPPNISWVQPWFDEANGLFNHMSRVCDLVHNTREMAQVLVIHPIQSVWAEISPLHKISPTYSIWAEKNPYAGANYIVEAEHFEKPFFDLSRQLNQAGISYHYGDEIVMKEIGSFDESLRIGNCRYQTVIIPPVSVLKENTIELLAQLARFCGKESVIFVGQIPECVSQEYKSLFTVTESVQKAVALANKRFARKVVIKDQITGNYADKVLCRCGMTANGKNTVFLVNPEPERSFQLQINLQFAPSVMDTVTGKIYTIPALKAGNQYQIELTLAAGGSVLLCEEATEQNCPVWLQTGVRFRTAGNSVKIILPELTVRGNNILPLDVVDLHLPDKQLSQKPIELLWHTEFYPLPEGTKFTVDYRFYVEQIPEKSVTAYIEMARNLDAIILNGIPQQITSGKTDSGVFDQCFDAIVLQGLKTGENVLRIVGRKNNNIIGVGNHRSVPAGQTHNPTELESIYLSGEFGVWLGPDGFTIGKCPENVTGLLNQCGYPFYSGKIATEFTVPENCCQIRLQAKAHSASLYIDGELADVAYVKPFCFPVLSSNWGRQAKIVLSGSVENTFGPLHLAQRDQLSMIGPQLIANASRYTPEYELFDYGLWQIICDIQKTEVSK